MVDIQGYRNFISSKKEAEQKCGFLASELNPRMKKHQRVAVDFALSKGRSAMFLDTGLGKSLCELEFANQVVHETGKPVLILTPLAVAAQMVRKYIGFELKPEYAAQANKNLLEAEKTTGDLFA